MKAVARPGLALTAVYSAVAVPILLPAFKAAHVADGVTGFVMGGLLGSTMVMLFVAIRSSRNRG